MSTADANGIGASDTLCTEDTAASTADANGIAASDTLRTEDIGASTDDANGIGASVTLPTKNIGASTADANGIAASDTLPTEEIGASTVNNIVGGIDSGSYVGNKNINFSAPVDRDIDASTIASVGAIDYIKDATNNTSDTTSIELVSPPCVERTTFNKPTTKETNTVRTPKRPKVISIEGYASNKLSYTQDNASSSSSIHQDSTASSTSSLNCDNSLLRKIANIIPYPIKIWRRAPTEAPSIRSFLDIVDLTSNSCCGYTYILRMVDPVHRYGHAVVLKSLSKGDVCYSLSRLMMVVRIQPTTLYFSQSLSYLEDVSEQYPKTKFECHEHSEAMINEREIFLMQLHKWIANEKNWVVGVAVIQAVSNTMPIRPAQDQPN
jgi:hypothetical protein